MSWGWHYNGCMSTPKPSRTRRLRAALVALWALLALPLAALPPEALRGSADVCFMDCSHDGGACCCLLLRRAGQGHGHSRSSGPVFDLAAEPCSEACMAASTSTGVRLPASSARARGNLEAPSDHRLLASCPAPVRARDLFNPATRPRSPPPALLAFA